jgi:hypothetical protein
MQNTITAQEDPIARKVTINWLREREERKRPPAFARTKTCHTRQPINPATMLVPKKTRVGCAHNSTVTDEANSNLKK